MTWIEATPGYDLAARIAAHFEEIKSGAQFWVYWDASTKEVVFEELPR